VTSAPETAQAAADESSAQALRRLAETGDPEAQAVLGQWLLDGRELARDSEQALHWFRLAAHADHAMATNMVGRCHELGWGTPVDLGLAAVWYRKAAEKGLDWGMYNYAHALAGGRGVGADRALAFELYRRAASLGHAKAMTMVGRFHERGWETPCDPRLAAQWYRRAAEGGDFRGQAHYAAALASAGRMEEAMRWLRLAFDGATPAFASILADEVERSGAAPLRDLARGYRV
jgi:TPR repeat protein